MALSKTVSASVTLWFHLTINNTIYSQFSVDSPGTRPRSRYFTGVYPINPPDISAR